MVMDRHGKLILAGLPGLDLRAPYSGACVVGRLDMGKTERASGFWDLLAWDVCSERV